MKTIDFDIWEANPDKPGTVRRVGQRTAQEVFAELQHHLESTGYLPDEYFLMNDEWKDGKEIPEGAGFFCTVDYGGSDITVVAAFAEQLHKLELEGRLPVYKAMLEAAPKDLTLDEAVDLAGQAVDFRLQREIPSPLEYAQAEIMKHDIPLKDELINSRNLYSYGQKLMEAQGAVDTDYGILLSENGMTVEQCLGRPDQHMEMR